VILRDNEVCESRHANGVTRKKPNGEGGASSDSDKKAKFSIGFEHFVAERCSFVMMLHTKFSYSGRGRSKPDLSIALSGYSCVELILGVLTISASFFAWSLIVGRFGALPAIAGVISTLIVCTLISITFVIWLGGINARERQRLDDQFRLVYRVIEVSESLPSVKREGVEIKSGDFGWEAEPIFQDGLTYLHGLSKEWKVVWYAGFHRDQIELVAVKPRSQYFLPPSWTCAGVTPPVCPYAVAHDTNITLGFPEKIDLPFVQGLRIDTGPND